MRRTLALALIVGSSIAMAAPVKKKTKKRAHARKAIAHSVQKKSEPAVKKTTEKTTEKEPTDPSRLELAPKDVTATPAYRYGAMSRSECLDELKTRKIAFTREGDTRGVMAPVRLTGPLHGVTFRTNQPAKRRATSPWEIGDCRLILAVDDFAAILATHDVVEVIHYSMYRNKLKSAEDEWGRRHPGGLALDAAKFVKKDGTTLVVDQHFNGAIDDKTCGDGAVPHPETPEALELRVIVCAAATQHLFNVILTPNYNQAHHNHFHLEVTAGVKWFLLH
jgi:hypothetical protein